jgi:DnaJ-class molecular chaperone
MVTSETYQLLTHEIAPKSSALTCASCHGTSATQMNLRGLGYTLKGPRSTVCTQCHGPEDDELNWQAMHDKHVKDKRYDCSFCHTFTRPERGLRTTRGGDD